MNENFELYKKIKELSFDVLKQMNNVPRNLFYVKESLIEAFNSCIKLIRYYVVNSNETERVKLKYLKDLLVELSFVDYQLEVLYKFKALGKNRYTELSNKLTEIRKITQGVINSEKK